MTSLAHQTSVDPSQLIGVSSQPARVVMWLFVFSNFLYAFTTLDDVKHPIPVLIAVVLVNGAAVLLVVDHPDPFPRLWTTALILAVATSTLLVAFQLPDVGPPGRASWHLGSNTWLLFFLAMRRRPGAAWLGYSLMAAGTFVWTLSAGRSLMSAVLLLDTHTAILFVATLFALNLRRTARGINAFEHRAVASAIESAEGATSARIRRRRVRELRASAVPLIERLIEQGPPQTPDERRAYATAEALLRDAVRGRSLMTPQISAATTAARGRGVDVTLLDDRGEGLPTGAAMVRLGEAVVDALDGAESGSVTVRLGPLGRPSAVSIVTSWENGRRRLELDETGLALEGRGSETELIADVEA